MLLWQTHGSVQNLDKGEDIVINLSKRLFGKTGEAEVCRHLVQVINAWRMSWTLSPEDVDLKFGVKDGERTWREIDKDNSLITQARFYRIAWILKWKIDKVLNLELDDQIRRELVEEMEEMKTGIVACGGGDGKRPPLEQQVTVYAVLKVLQEVDDREITGEAGVAS